LKVSFLGSGGPYVTKENSCPSILLNRNILMDCGSGSLKNFKLMGFTLGQLEKVMITHFHADHVCDLVALIWAMQMEDRKKALEVLGHIGVKEMTEGFLKLTNTPEEFIAYPLVYKPLKGTEDLGEVKVCKTDHKPTNLAYRVELDGRSVCYTGDTAFHEPLAKFAYKCDLIIHDAAFSDEQRDIALMTKHSTAGQAGRIAELAEAKKLALFHLFPFNRGRESEMVSQAAKEFSGEVFVAQDLQELEL